MEQANNDDGSAAESGFAPSNTANGNSSTAMPTAATNLGTPNPALDENSSKSWTPMKNNSNNSGGSALKDKRHFKKSMIVEYEKIESQHNDDSQSSSSCASFGSPLLSKPLSQAISQAQSKLAATIPGFGTTTSNSAQHDSLSNLCDASANLLSAPLINFNQHFSNLNSQISRLSNNGGLMPAENLPTREEESSTQSSTKTVNVKKEKNSSEYDSSSKASISTKRKKEENPSESAKSSSKHKKAKSGESSHHHHHHGKEHHHHHYKSDSKKSKSDKLSSPKTSKKNKEEKKTSYCICREQANKRFMIACDNCDEWYHGACVGVSESLSNKIKSFYCHICRNKKPSLSIKYKSKFRSLAELIENNEKFDESSADSSSVKFYKESKARLKREAELLRDSKPQSKKSSDHVVKESTSSTDVKLESNISLDASSSSSTKYYGKTNIPSEDIANFFSAITILNQNPSQAASAVAATKENAMPKTTTSKSTVNQMDHDYLAPSTSQSSHSRPLQTSQGEAYPVRKQSRSSDEVHQDDEASLESFSSVSTSSTATSSGGTSSSSRTRSPSGSDSSQESTSSEQDDDDDDEETGDSSSEQDDGHDSASNSSSFKKSFKRPDQKAKASKTLKGQPKNKKGAAPKKTNLKGKKTKPVKRLNKQQTKTKKTVTFGSGGLKPSASALSVNSNSNIGDESTPQRNEPSQCQGPGCVNESKEESKYCSDECAMKMARNRLIHFLDSEKCDFESMLSPSNADKLNIDAIEKINAQMELLRQRLVDLEQKHADLDKIIERAKFSSINPNIEKDRAKSQDSNETEIFCATCGLLVSEKLALKHMEKCYNKIESLAFFGSFHKTHIESGKPLFCDYFNPQTKMYCKRLKTMCPEHEKEKKINENEVCGCPLPNPKNLLEDSKSDLCLAPKRSCSVHFKWEKLRRAQIDLEKLRTWLKLEELLEQKRLNEASLNQRRNLLSLMLYKTNLNNTIKSTS